MCRFPFSPKEGAKGNLSRAGSRPHRQTPLEATMRVFDWEQGLQELQPPPNMRHTKWRNFGGNGTEKVGTLWTPGDTDARRVVLLRARTTRWSPTGGRLSWWGLKNSIEFMLRACVCGGTRKTAAVLERKACHHQSRGERVVGGGGRERKGARERPRGTFHSLLFDRSACWFEKPRTESMPFVAQKDAEELSY